ncbi:ATP-dependent DNA helicase DinG [Solibacillus sp. CAU 1738]|uniref:ATP-dependent DNA helicase DinG n=1 Tax=Solibacillus sp. CAU 1738 TaxID=3140363 RepID=UPI0032619417
MMESQKYAIVDLETTGHSPANGDRMIQIAIVVMRDWCIEKTFTSFIHPGKSIPLFIQDLTNITDTDVADALPFEAHADYIYELLQDAVFVAHNTDFDLAFLQAEFKRAGLPKWHGKKIDTVELAKILYPTSLSYKLGDLAHDLNIPLKNAHRADDDAKATALLLKACWEKLLQLPQVTLEQLHKRSFRLKSDIAQLFFSALHEKRQTVSHDEDYIIYQKIAMKRFEKRSATYKNDAKYPKTRKDKMELLKKAVPNFEERPLQFQMMDKIWHSLLDKQEVVIEASTGIGKTLSYLLPAFYYAKESGRKVGISTYTSHLLDQLLNEEVTKLEAITGEKIHVALLKGMQNYVDVERFEKILKMQDDSYDETLAIIQVLIWLVNTETGDLNELNVSGGGQLFLDKIRKTVLETNIPSYFDFYERAIYKSKHADLIITNHAMLLADLVRHEQLFSEIGGWIVDEAHQFIQAAVQRDEKVFSFMNWKYLFGQIGLYTDEQLFYRLQRVALKKHRVSMQLLQQTEKRFMQMVTLFDEVMQSFVEALQPHFRNSNKHEMKQTIFLSEVVIDYKRFGQVSAAIQNWIDLAEQVLQTFHEHTDEIAPEHQFILDEWLYWIREFKVKVAEWDEVFLIQHNHYSAWIEVDKRSIPGSVQLFKKPINVTTVIQQLFTPIRERAAVIWTSGTLTVPNNERFISDQLGVSAEVPIYKLQAPAKYYGGAKAFVVTDMPEIQVVSQNDYIEAVAHAITRTVRTTEGRCFVLFTSQDMLRKTVELIQESELLEDYMLFAQGVTAGSRMRLLKSFQKFSQSVLFGTNSFWEGVDVPGDGLASVIVVRLPFSSPDEPTFKARAQYLQSEGRNPFAELSLPEAILRFKQGFGRLIRSSQDKGVLIVLDRRIDTKSYGKEFIRALPPISVQKLPLQHMVQALGTWYNNKHE